jgi:aspartate/tyrosine/aromatic aminotransferase
MALSNYMGLNDMQKLYKEIIGDTRVELSEVEYEQVIETQLLHAALESERSALAEIARLGALVTQRLLREAALGSQWSINKLQEIEDLISIERAKLA